MAHTWFGDLTTMKWWNDLWLKESFADYCCLTCFTESPVNKMAPSFESAGQSWLEFLEIALNADLLASTHPIQVGIKHTGDAVSAFDAISYKKGASWIKTMDYFIGREAL